MCVSYVHINVFSRPEERYLSVAEEIVKMPEIPLDSKQPETSLKARKKDGRFLPKLTFLQKAQVQYIMG